MTKRRILIALAALFGVFVLVLVVGLASLISMLPGRSEIAKKLEGGEPSQTQKAPVPQASNPKEAATTSATTVAASEVPASETPEEKAKREKKAQDQKNEALLEKLMSEDPSDIRVCDNLGRKQLSKKQLEEERTFDEMMTDRDDPMNEAFRYPILQVFNDPALKDLFAEVKENKAKTENQTDAEKDSWLEKAGFYSRLAYTGAKVLSRKSEFEHMGNQAMHLTALAKLTALKPEIAARGDLQSLCRLIENKAKNGQESDLRDERQQLVEIFKDAGVDPKTVGFDPSKWIHFTMKYDKKSLMFNLSDDDAAAAGAK
jgi:hypothetical protein